MASWKLTRQGGVEQEYKFSEKERITIGRGFENTLPIESIVVSRYHCEIYIQRDEVIITDLESSNGTFIGTKKLAPNKPYSAQHLDIIGFGWAFGANFENITESEKHIFKLEKIQDAPSIVSRINFQDDLEYKISILVGNNMESGITQTFKRKDNYSSHQLIRKMKEAEPQHDPIEIRDDIVNIVFESDEDLNENDYQPIAPKKIKLESNAETEWLQDELKEENNSIEYEAFEVKQEYLAYDDEPIQVDSDSDIESDCWFLRLSQNSPGKPFTKISQDNRTSEINQKNCSYSQLDDYTSYENDNNHDIEHDIVNDLNISDNHMSNKDSDIQQEVRNITNNISEDVEECNIIENPANNLITLNNQVPKQIHDKFDCSVRVDGFKTANLVNQLKNNNKKPTQIIKHLSNRDSDNLQGIRPVANINISKENTKANEYKASANGMTSITNLGPKQLFEGFKTDNLINHLNKGSILNNVTKKIIQLIPAPSQPIQKKSSTNTLNETKKNSSSSKHIKKDKNSKFKKLISSANKETRRKKLKEIAEKDKINENEFVEITSSSSNKGTANVKITSSNRGAFLAKAIENVKPNTKKHNNIEIHKNINVLSITKNKNNIHESTNDDKILTSFSKEKCEKLDSITNIPETSSEPNKIKNMESKNTIRNISPIEDSEDKSQTKNTISEKPPTKVIPTSQNKPKKMVRFSEEPPKVLVFPIDPGKTMKKTNMVNTLDRNEFNRYSLEKLTLVKILRWNPSWLEEQIHYTELPPILDPNVLLSPKLHLFEDSKYYQQCFGDLLLIEIWDCLTVAYMKARNVNNIINLRIESLPPIPPPVPPPEKCFKLYNISVSMQTHSSNTQSVPRVGEIILVNFGYETAQIQKFFYVHKVRCLPSYQNSTNLIYSISLQAAYTPKMQLLNVGDVIYGKKLVYINKDLMLFEAMEYLYGSPLCNAILSPKPHYFPRIDKTLTIQNDSRWTITLNPSQKRAVMASVNAALNDEPCINMIQGPPGTGKSSVICTIIMTYFYDTKNRKHENRGKILVCATSNAAVDELVLRLLNIRQTLPLSERFRMVRVGREEAMHPGAADLSSQHLALRNARLQVMHNHRTEFSVELSHLQAKKNRWKTEAHYAKDPARVAYCQTRITEIYRKIAIVQDQIRARSDVGAIRSEVLYQNETRIIERADIVLTTLGSAQNNKMKLLKERIALCIIDEAGQAIEPETLIPLTLGVKQITLIGDPQQLPGFICSQRAKQQGLGESLFFRLTSCMETWSVETPVILLEEQYRMHKEIADYPNRAFYNSKIKTGSVPRLKLNIPPYTVLSISSGNKGQGPCGANEIEAWGVARIVIALNNIVSTMKLTLGVITPYNAHKELLKKILRTLDPRLVSIDVNTVDSFQGQERDVVVVSLARSQGVGFLMNTGRMNVMLTRAKEALIVCLNPTAMLKNDMWRTLIEDAQKRKVYKMLPSKVCRPIHNIPISDDVLKYLQN